jgi:hypothetical protein
MTRTTPSSNLVSLHSVNTTVNRVLSVWDLHIYLVSLHPKLNEFVMSLVYGISDYKILKILFIFWIFLSSVKRHIDWEWQFESKIIRPKKSRLYTVDVCIAHIDIRFKGNSRLPLCLCNQVSETVINRVRQQPATFTWTVRPSILFVLNDVSEKKWDKAN